MAQQLSSYLPSFFRSANYLPVNGNDDANGAQPVKVRPNYGQFLRSKAFRIVGATIAILLVGSLVFYKRDSVDFSKWKSPPASQAPEDNSGKDTAKPPQAPPAECPDKDVDWSKYAYIQYVTNTEYLCNSVMLFEILHRLGSKADRLMMYPANMHPDGNTDSTESRLLLKAQKEYNVKLTPVEVQHKNGGEPTWADSYTKLLAFNQTQYKRVLSLDSDSTVLQSMDELFLLPSAPVAMPRAYWLDKPFLSSQLVLIEPSVDEFKRVKEAIDHAQGGEFDMEIVNTIYGADCIIIPHRKYDLLTGEFRGKEHKKYLGNEYEKWDPEKILKEAKFLHFSDWPYPKPWIPASDGQTQTSQPECVNENGREDCAARKAWLGFYSDFRARRKSVCDMGNGKVKRSESLRPRGKYEFLPDMG